MLTSVTKMLVQVVFLLVLVSRVHSQKNAITCLPTGLANFDVVFYSSTYPDLASYTDRAKAMQHYCLYGADEGRMGRSGGCPGGGNPMCRGFVKLDASWYLNTYPDLKSAWGNDVGKAATHYQEYGETEYRQPCPGFLLVNFGCMSIRSLC